MTPRHWMVALACCVNTAWSAPPTTEQFAQGIEVMPQSPQPLVELTLPDEVYRTATRADLADVRVFDANGNVVPHAFCMAPQILASFATFLTLPVIELRAAGSNASSGTQIDVDTDRGTHVAIRDSATSEKPVSTQAHVIDATQMDEALRSIAFDWETADGSSEAQVRIDASDDLDQWRSVVPATRLVHAGSDGQQLLRARVPLPLQKYRYLRVERVDGGAPITIHAARAEAVPEAEHIEPHWFTPVFVNANGDGRAYRSDHRAPVRYARLKLPFDNMTVRATVQSRPNDKASWTTRWSGEMYAIVTNGERKASAPAEFIATSDREWRVQFAGDVAGAVGLELGYRPALLRFVAQGNRPFTVAYGSGQIENPTARGCEQLLGDMEPKKLRELIGDAALGAPRELGGEDAFRPLPKKTPVRLMVLWGALIVGVAVLVAMALSLLRRVRGVE
ncbi:MAG TPA: DUF3999 domain-containing protein [Steroidobacteraceae bacterium]|nr:DUF3999 domain-containing protein [Steroidobacteraceae bacterium]